MSTTDRSRDAARGRGAAAAASKTLSLSKTKAKAKAARESTASTAPTAPTDLTAPRETLEAALGMLSGFHHRHKNQHRLSAYWWAPFQQLRRHASKLRADLRAREAVGAPYKKRQRAADEAVARRATWIRIHLVPKAYLGFSRLVVDKQFAPLGLFLLGLLAQIRSVLVQVSPDDDNDNDDKNNDDSRSKGGETIQKENLSVALPAPDLGEAVARSSAGQFAGQGRTEKDRNNVRPVENKERVGNREDEEDEAEEPLLSERVDRNAERLARKAQKEKKEKKEKKRKRGGDEFDDLFSGLI